MDLNVFTADIASVESKKSQVINNQIGISFSVTI